MQTLCTHTHVPRCRPDDMQPPDQPTTKSVELRIWGNSTAASGRRWKKQTWPRKRPAVQRIFIYFFKYQSFHRQATGKRIRTIFQDRFKNLQVLILNRDWFTGRTFFSFDVRRYFLIFMLLETSLFEEYKADMLCGNKLHWGQNKIEAFLNFSVNWMTGKKFHFSKHRSRKIFDASWEMCHMPS